MGNRLICGNYTEGYNLIDKDGLALNLDYTVEVNSKNIGAILLLHQMQLRIPIKHLVFHKQMLIQK